MRELPKNIWSCVLLQVHARVGSLQSWPVCASGAELQVNAKGYHNHRSGSLRFLVCVREREIEGGCFEGEQVVSWCSKAKERVSKRQTVLSCKYTMN